jgi:hypothetical protein
MPPGPPEEGRGGEEKGGEGMEGKGRGGEGRGGGGREGRNPLWDACSPTLNKNPRKITDFEEFTNNSGKVDKEYEPSRSWTELKRQACEAAVTRSMAKRAEKPMRPLKSAEIDTSSINYEVLKEEQKLDESLKKYWRLSESKEQDASKACFIVKKGSAV